MIALYYEIPIFAILILLVYFIFENLKIWKQIKEPSFRTIYLWLALAGIAMFIWGLDHIYHDLAPVSEELKMIMHYGVSHGFLLISIIFLTLAGINIRKFRNKFNFKKIK